MGNQVIEGFKLSPQQKRLWLLQQKSRAFQAQCAVLIEGNLNIELLKAALQQVIQRHEILRTTFHRRPGIKVPIQVVGDNIIPAWQSVNLSELDTQEQEVKIQEVLQNKRKQPVNFEEASLFHLCLLTLSDKNYILLINLPALCADTQSLKNLVREISQAYTAIFQGKDLDDEEEIVQYLQFSEWQNQLLDDEDSSAGKEYWNQPNLSNLETLKLLLENSQSIQKEFSFASYEWKLGSDLLNNIEAFIQNSKTSASTFFLAAWLVLLRQLTGQGEMTIGTAFDGRPYEELEKALGLFAKDLPLSFEVKPHAKFIEILKQINDSVNEAYEWQEYFTGEETALSAVNSNNPIIFPIEFEFADWSLKEFTADISFSIYQHSVCFDRFKLKLACYRQGESITVAIHYDISCFTEEAISCLADQFQTLLESAIKHPDSAVSELNLLSERALHQLTVEFNQTTVSYPKDKCIHQLIEAQAELTPDAIAVVFENQYLTYRELNEKANQLAHYLQQLGVGSDVVVGLLVERSLELLIGMLGILKAGGAYLPIDPALPASGVALRLQDAQASIVISQQSLVESKGLLTADKGERKVICLDTDWERIAEEPRENPISEVKPENLVYVIYTSGSTGVPKGVAIEHQSLLNYVYSIQEILDLPSGASFATVSTFSADLGNTVIFPALCSGGCLHIVSAERASNPDALAEYFQRHPIDCLKIVPSHLKALLTAEAGKHILPRKQLVLGGEACHWDLIGQIQQLAPTCKILNHYGPTEATVGVLTYPIELSSEPKSGIVPIGRPIANTQVYLLNSELKPVPIGVLGEIYISGAGLAREYLKQPELTADKFINNPFRPNEQFYKTGDLARYQLDGTIEFIGRIDHQVKIHGFRIELGEIEAALIKHSAVRECVVVAREDEPGKQRLVAYVVPQPKLAPTSSELRQFLLELLPEYMVPSVFVHLKTLPLTLNGKVDRQALPAPDTSRSSLEATYVPPRTPTEEILAEIWVQVLGVEQVGIHDNFFELGGDSILSIQIIAKAHQAGLQLTPKQLFEYQTIAELAAVAHLSSVTAEQGIVTGSVPLTPIQNWFFEQNQPEAHHWNQAVLLEARQTLAPALLEQAVQKLLEHHDALRLRFVQQELSWEQVNADINPVVPFTQLNLSELSESEQTAAIEATATELQASLNLSEGRLLRVAFFNLGASSRLLIVIHHLAADGVSWRILLEDFQTAYEQLSQNKAIQLPAKTTSFKQWAERLQEYASSAVVQQERNYWITQAKKPIQLPIAHSGGANTVASEKTITVALSAEETQALLQDVPAAYRTQINEVLLTALVQAFESWTGEKTLLVDLEGHGREDIFKDVNLSRTVGWFTSIFPVRLDLGDVENRNFASSSGEALKAVKEQLRSIPNRGIGYGVLRYLNQDEQLRSLPSAEVKFNYLGQFDQVLSETSLFKPASESSGSDRSLKGNRTHLLIVNGLIVDHRLQLNWLYSEAIHQASTIENLAQRFLESLRSIIAHCQSPEAKGYTPSDFPEAQLSQQDLNQFLARISQKHPTNL